MVNPSPYMIYLQARGSILVASSPEILCHVGADRTVTNRSLISCLTLARAAALATQIVANLIVANMMLCICGTSPAEFLAKPSGCWWIIISRQRLLRRL